MCPGYRVLLAVGYALCRIVGRFAALTSSTRRSMLGGCDSVYVERLDDAVAARLVDEFGEDGRRCVEFLETAHVLLCGGFRSVPRWGQTVAYCLREAMTAVLEAARLGDAGRWNEVSRGVVAAGREYRRAEDDPGPERDRLLGVLLARIDDLEGFSPRGATSAATVERCDGQPYGCCAALCSCFAC